MPIMRYIYIYSFISDYCWYMQKNHLVKNYDSWGKVFSISFSITVFKSQSWDWTNVFHFTADGDNEKFGDRIPALFINKNKYFQICSAVNDVGNYCKKYYFELRKEYSIMISQYQKGNKYFFQIIIDNVIKLEVENTQAKYFLNVKFYASNPWSFSGFHSDLGKACDFNIVSGGGT